MYKLKVNDLIINKYHGGTSKILNIEDHGRITISTSNSNLMGGDTYNSEAALLEHWTLKE